MFLIPIIAGVLFRMGGTDQWKWCFINQKVWRWLGIGIFLGVTFAIIRHSWIPLLAIPSYAIAIQAAPYGEKSWLNFLGEYGKYAICGIAFGLASAPILGNAGIAEAILSGCGFALLHWLDEKNIVKNPWQEVLRGVAGTILFVFA